MSKSGYCDEHHVIETWTINDATLAMEPIYNVYQNLGVIYNSRDKEGITVALDGVISVKLLDGETVVLGTPLKNNNLGNPSDEAAVALAGEAYFGYALEAITVADGDYVTCMVNPGNLI